MPDRLGAEAVTLRYDARVISENLSLHIPDGSFTAIIGPNACGKSTLLRGLSRLLLPEAGRIVLDEPARFSTHARQVAPADLRALPEFTALTTKVREAISHP